MFHWRTVGGSGVGVEEEAVLVVGAAVVLGASSRGVRVASSLDSWRCRRTACRRASVFLVGLQS